MRLLRRCGATLLVGGLVGCQQSPADPPSGAAAGTATVPAAANAGAATLPAASNVDASPGAGAAASPSALNAATSPSAVSTTVFPPPASAAPGPFGATSFAGAPAGSTGFSPSFRQFSPRPAPVTVPLEVAAKPLKLVDVAAVAGVRHRAALYTEPPGNIVGLMSGGAAFIDFDQDGWSDILLADLEPLLFRNRGDGRFDRVEDAFSGIARGFYHGVAVGDYDLDGFPDVYLSAYRGGSLLHNEGGKGFVDATSSMRLPAQRWGSSASFADLDRDGRPDLIVGNYLQYDPAHALLCQINGVTTDCGPEYYLPEKPRVYRNTPAGFEDVTGAWGFDASGGRTLGVAARDLDGDGQLEVLLANDLTPGDLFVRTPARDHLNAAAESVSSRAPGSGGGTAAGAAAAGGAAKDGAAARSASTGGSAAVAAARGARGAAARSAVTGGAAGGSGAAALEVAFDDWGVLSGTAYDAFGKVHAGMGIDAGDYDRDGILDLVVTAFYREGASLYRASRRHLFRDLAYSTGVGAATWPYVGWGVQFVDLDNDGWLDLLIANGHIFDNATAAFPGSTYEEPLVMLYNQGGRYFDVSSKLEGAAAGDILGRGLAAADYDQDGRIDLLVVNAIGDVLLLHNESERVGRWLSVHLEDRHGVEPNGAWVQVTVAGQTRVESYHTDGSFLSSSEPWLHLGLGEAREVTRISVRWPSGALEHFGPFQADRRVALQEGGGRRAP